MSEVVWIKDKMVKGFDIIDFLSTPVATTEKSSAIALSKRRPYNMAIDDVLNADF